jgi:hypothetical protein
MVTGVRSETTVFTSLANIHLWLTQNQGAEVELPGLHLHVGLPITAPRAVICTVWLLEKAGGSTPLLAGRLRGLTNPRDGSVRLVFDGTAAPELAGRGAPATGERVHDELARVARHLLEMIALDCNRVSELISA